MSSALTGGPASPGVKDQQDSDEILGFLRHQRQAWMVKVHLTGENILLQLDRVPEFEINSHHLHEISD